MDQTVKKTDKQAEQCLRALKRAHKFFGSKATMARRLGVTSNAVGYWFTRGQIGRFSAVTAEAIPDFPMKKEYMRPDIKDWRPMTEREKAIAAALNV